MAELSREDVRQAVHNEIANLLGDIHYIREASTRNDQQVNNLRQLPTMASELQRLSEQAQVWQSVRPNDIQDIKLRVQNIEKGIAQIVQYLQATDHERNEDAGYRGA